MTRELRWVLLLVGVVGFATYAVGQTETPTPTSAPSEKETETPEPGESGTPEPTPADTSLPTPDPDDFGAQELDDLPGLLFTREISDDVVIHTYAYRNATRQTTSTLVESKNQFTMFDVLPTEQETKVLVDSLFNETDKNVTRVYITSEDTDHVGGLAYFLNRVSTTEEDIDVSVFALPSVLARMDDKDYDFEVSDIEVVEPDTPVFVEREALTLEIEEFEGTTVPTSLKVTLDDLGVIIAGDALLNGFHYPPQEYAEFAAHRATAEDLVKDDATYYIPGRGAPGGIELPTFAAEYIGVGLDVATRARLASQYADEMQELYPDLVGRGKMLQAARRLDFPLVPEDGVEPARTISPTDSPGDEGVCFPASATVQLDSGKRLAMGELEVGDRVRTGGAGEESGEVYFFSHKAEGRRSQFVEMEAAGRVVRLSGSHYVWSQGRLVPARLCRPGMMLRTSDGEEVAVEACRRVVDVGLYAPHTLSHTRTLAVDGIVVSEFTEAVDPRIAVWLLAPLRAAYRAGFRPMSRLYVEGHEWAKRLGIWTASEAI